MEKRERLTDKIAASKEIKPRTKKQEVECRDTSGFKYDTSKAKVLKRCLHSLNVSLGTLISAMKDIAIIRGSELTPDGKLGGRGFIMPFKEIKMQLTEAISNLSDITDTIADELTNPQWKLSKEEVSKVKKDQEQLDEETEEVEEELVENSPEESSVKEEDISDSDVDINEDESSVGLEASDDISPSDVKDHGKQSSLDRYREILTASSDSTCTSLGKSILANLLRGDR